MNKRTIIDTGGAMYTPLEDFYLNKYAGYTPSRLMDEMEGCFDADDYHVTVFTNGAGREVSILHAPSGLRGRSTHRTLFEGKREAWALLQAKISQWRSNTETYE